MARVLRELEASQNWPAARLQTLQQHRLQALLGHAWETTTWYRERWRAAGLDVNALQDPAAWTRVPPLEKQEIQRHADEMRSSRAPKGLAASTSGSSGTPVAVIRSHLSWAHAHANVIRGWRWNGIEVGDRYAYFWGVPLDEDGRRTARRKDIFFNRERCSAFALDRSLARDFHRRLLERPARWAFGYPSAVTRFAEEILGLGLDGRALRWRAVVTSAEVLRDAQRALIAETFGCPVVDSYGCAEAGVAGFECDRGTMHVPVESVLVEAVPADDGAHELLLTDLHNWSQPLIRYRVGDLVSPATPETTCECGRALPILGRVHGRAGDTLVLPDGRRLNANAPSYIFKKHGLARRVSEYQFVQHRDGRIELRVVPGPAWTDGLVSALRSQIGDVLGFDPEVHKVDRIERSGRGKHRDFVHAEDLRDD